MDKLAKLICFGGLIIVCNTSFAWSECAIEFSVVEVPNLQCDEESKVVEVEARIITDEPLNPNINCTWPGDQPTQTLEKVGNVCRAKITISEPELHWVRVWYEQGFGEGGLIKECKTIGKLDVKPMCCTAL